jgi:hypothetical protein
VKRRMQRFSWIRICTRIRYKHPESATLNMNKHRMSSDYIVK